MMTTQQVAKKSDTAVYTFKTSREAWAFMRACDAAGISAGFPGLLTHTVQVGITTWMDRETTDGLAGVPVTSYEFGK